MEYYIRTYGYVGVAAWAAIGGEEGILVSAFLAAAGYFSLPGVILASAVGGSLGDQIYFYLARKHGGLLLTRSERLRRVYPRAEKLLQKYGAAVVLASRFMAGLRIAIATVCGLFKMPPVKYSVLNFVSALVWSSFYGLLAYHLGPALRSRMPSVRSPQFWAVVLAIGGAALLLRLWLRKKVAQTSAGVDRGEHP